MLSFKRLKFLNIRSTYLWLAAILALGFGLRIYGISFGLPYLYNPDEYLMVDPAVRILVTGDLNPHWFGYPGSILIYCLSVLYSIFFLIGKATGQFAGLAEFHTLLKSDPTSFYLIGRTFTVSLGAVSILFVYHLARRIYHQRTALAAALIFSVSFLHAVHSQLIRPDIILTFFLIIAVFYCVDILQNNRFRSYVLFGVFTGLALSAKYVGVMLLAPLLFAVWLAEGKTILIQSKYSKGLFIFLWTLFAGMTVIVLDMILFKGRFILNSALLPNLAKTLFSSDGELNQMTLNFINMIRRAIFAGCLAYVLIYAAAILFKPLRYLLLNTLTHRKLWIALAVTLLAFFISTPFVFLDLRTTLACISFEARGSHVGAETLGGLSNFWWYIRHALLKGLGLQILLLAFLGMGVILYRRQKQELFLLVFPAAFFIFIGNAQLRWERWIIPLVPFMSVFAAVAVKQLYCWSQHIVSNRRIVNIIFSIGLILLCSPLALRICEHGHFIIQKDSRTESREWVEANIPPKTRIAQEWFTGPLDSSRFDLFRTVSLSNYPFTFFVENHYKYLLVASWHYNRAFESSEKYPQKAEFYQTLFSEYALVHEILQDPKQKPGPTIRIYKMNQDSMKVNE